MKTTPWNNRVLSCLYLIQCWKAKPRDKQNTRDQGEYNKQSQKQKMDFWQLTVRSLHSNWACALAARSLWSNGPPPGPSVHYHLAGSRRLLLVINWILNVGGALHRRLTWTDGHTLAFGLKLNVRGLSRGLDVPDAPAESRAEDLSTRGYTTNMNSSLSKCHIRYCSYSDSFCYFCSIWFRLLFFLHAAVSSLVRCQAVIFQVRVGSNFN